MPSRIAPPPSMPAEPEPVDSVQTLLDEVDRERPPGPAQRPVLHVTPYERLTTFLVVLLLFAGITAFTLTLRYAAYRPKPPAAMADLELLEEDPGGTPDGSPDETLRVDSPYEERPDASLVDNPTNEPSQVEAVFDSIMDTSDDAVGATSDAAADVNVTDQSPQQFLLDVRSSGRLGSATGTGRRAMGFGNGKRGFPRDQRWYINHSDRVPVAEYARQLDFFGIELGAVFPDRIVYVSQMSGAPKQRVANTGKGENRLYMNWQGGSRRLADLEILRNAGIQADNALILHFYPQATETMLAKLERAAAKLPVDHIRRTFFAVNKVDGGYEFAVTRITYAQ